jgi:nucleoside-diphosphate-sugar epimerase
MWRGDHSERARAMASSTAHGTDLMNIFITGAGGYIGGSVAMALLANGHRVSGLARSSANAERLAKSRVARQQNTHHRKRLHT